MRIVALDVGSSSVRAVAYDDNDVAELGDAHVAYDDLDADVLVDACRSVLAELGDRELVAISAFWHSLVALDAHDRPLTPVLTWRETLGAHEPPALPGDYHRRTGCFAHPAYWPAKIARLQDEGVHAARYVSFGDYLVLKLAGELRTTVSTASGTGLFDPNRLDWDDDVLEALGLTSERLPLITDEPIAGVVPALGDGACSNVGAGCVTRGRAALMIGTSGALRVVYEADHAEPRDGWDPTRRGLVAGLSFATTPLDVAQAALEGVAYRFADVLDALGGVEEIVATGGALLANPDWMQIVADALGRPLHVSAVAEASARGAALVALGRLDLGAPIDRVVEPRADRQTIHRHAREVHRVAMRWKESE